MGSNYQEFYFEREAFDFINCEDSIEVFVEIWYNIRVKFEFEFLGGQRVFLF